MSRLKIKNALKFLQQHVHILIKKIILYCHLQHHNDTIIKTDAKATTHEGRMKASLTIIYTSHFISKVSKGCVGFYCERELETERKL